MGESQIVELAPRDRGAAIEVLAQAFRDNPLNRAVVGDGAERRLRCNRHGMRAGLIAAAPRAQLLGEFAPSPASPRGILLGLPPRGYPVSFAPFLAQLRCALGQGPRVIRRWAAVNRELETVHPVSEHWYLSLLGVGPEHQRLGIGARLLAAWLERVDRAGGAAYLETDRERNVGFYARFGFQVQREVRVLEVPIWCMWRPPDSA